MDKIKELLKELTLKEKASLCSGADMWHTKAIERLDIPSIMVSDGPHGLRRQPEGADQFGLHKSVPATCFPTASALACSWNPKLIYEVGETIAEECKAEGVSVLLGPGINIKRNPLCGRNFEYYSEDPYLSGKMGTAFIQGVQSKGIGTSLKHFAVNNQENNRMTINAVVDERALREIYLSGFEMAVKETQPWTVMCAYNKVNGTYASENRKLLTDILVDEWNFDGVVVSDWGAVNDRVQGLQAGLQLEMPGGGKDNDRKIVEAVKNGSLSMEELDAAVEKLLTLIFNSEKNKEVSSYDVEEHHQKAVKAAEESAVLLKNEEAILPLQDHEKGAKKIAVLGDLAVNPRYQGSGSSLINPTRLKSIHQVFSEKGIEFDYAKGYDRLVDKTDIDLVYEAAEIVKDTDVVIIVAGLSALAESEGFDREHMDLPHNQNDLIKEITSIHDNVIIVLVGGAPIEMPWINGIKGLLNMYLSGQGGAEATFDLLFGHANPSGKLGETYGEKYKDYPSGKYFPEGPSTVEYRESIYVGYRYFDKVKLEPLFPFGHGLSYTSFEFSNLVLSKKELSVGEKLTVKVDVTNTGSREGAEVVQLYVKHKNSSVFKAEKELKGFDKVSLNPGETKQCEFVLDENAFRFYYTKDARWCVESGDYEILVGSSSRDIHLTGGVTVHGVDLIGHEEWQEAESPYTAPTVPFQASDRDFSVIFGETLPTKAVFPGESFTYDSTLKDISRTYLGKKVYGAVMKQVMTPTKSQDGEVVLSENELVTNHMMEKMLPHNPLRSLVISSNGKLTYGMLDGLLLILNKKRLKGGGKLVLEVVKNLMP
ncbi:MULTISPECIES: glycoside hydrolase family 3 C-terminal domain-containing protein [Bacillaceae]|uniref:Glycoside hydrolase family 3 C-terminal domain-containing protein n=1 Tax=Evansella alkalicola TaxID=745819 RepID=A0ABS6JZQ4_9BACI|nr:MULTISPECIES: glycoside hydrolase family 3 N-terminal domain-containing protein [Bacillaceae]MBU9722580.1 glycoside hydrolase family 3 C-terminal domain-containing protein [Bacillus alkalicola]